MAKAVGFVDAYQDTDFLCKCFIQTRCFKESLEPEINYICGRRGAGKSAIVLNLKKQAKYHYVDHVEGTQFYQQFIDTLKPHAFAGEHVNVTYVFQALWKHLILTTAMNAIIASEYKNDYSYISANDSLMYEYLKSEKYLGKRPLSLWQKVIDALKKVIISASGKPNFVTEIIAQVTNILENDDFVAAENALKQRLSNGPKCLVIIVDTILDFFKKEEMFVACVEGLICAVLDLTCTKYHKNLEVKCCIPGEVYPHIKMWEKSKVRDHLIFIEWAPKDLIRMISKRLIYHLLSGKNAKPREFKEISWDDYDEVKRNAWDRYFPISIVNAIGQTEETHVYILRHTQQTPREIIRIVNEIVSSLEREGLSNDLDSKTLQSSIVNGVHEAVKSTMQELIDSNQYLIPNLSKILSNSFNSKPKVMSISEVRQCLAYSRKYWKQSELLNEEDDVITELISIGFAGLVLNYHDKKSLVYKTKFSYLSSDIGLDKDCHLAIHPIFYDGFNIKRECSRFVYPANGLVATWNDLDSIQPG